MNFFFENSGISLFVVGLNSPKLHEFRLKLKNRVSALSFETKWVRGG